MDKNALSCLAKALLLSVSDVKTLSGWTWESGGGGKSITHERVPQHSNFKDHLTLARLIGFNMSRF